MICRRTFLHTISAGLGAAVIIPLLDPRADAATLSPDTPLLDQFASKSLVDLEAHVSVVSAEQSELAKINRDFGMAYRLKSLIMRYKEPNKLRMEGSIGTLIINGAARHFRVPAIKLSRTDDLGESPGKRYTLMDVGLLTHGSLAVGQSRYVKDEAVGDVQARVFEMTYKEDASVRYLLWIDPKTHIIAKREWYDGSGKRKASFFYQQPKQVAADLWVPTRIEIRNCENVVAAVTAYSDVKVNQGLDEALFKIG
jgi:outer membrane lipoprotein-sorting protein